jgi:hypothetical protein
MHQRLIARPGAPLAIASAVLFGASTPFAKLLIGRGLSPLLLAGPALHASPPPPADRAQAPAHPDLTTGTDMPALPSAQSHSDDSDTSIRHARPCAGHPRIGTVRAAVVDGRIKSGHDEKVNRMSESEH